MVEKHVQKPIQKHVQKHIDKNTANFGEKCRLQATVPVKVLIANDDVTYLLDPDEIIFIEKVNKQLNFHTTEKELTTFGTLNGLAKKLPGYFFRSHRSYLINLKAVQAIMPTGRSYLVKFCRTNQKAILSYDRQKDMIDQVSNQGIQIFEQVHRCCREKHVLAETMIGEQDCRQVKRLDHWLCYEQAAGYVSPPKMKSFSGCKVEEEYLRENEKAHEVLQVQKVIVDAGKGVYFLDPEEIYFLEKIDKKVIYHTKDREYQTVETFEELVGKLPQYFYRSHRSFLINMTKVGIISSNAGRGFRVGFTGTAKEALLSYCRKQEFMRFWQ